MDLITNIKKDLKSKVSEKRYKHSLLVAKEAYLLAKHYQIDATRAYIVGLLHDITKEMPYEEQLKLVGTFSLDEKLIHSYSGAIYAKNNYHLTDQECLAIKYHTIGNPNMDLLAKIIYISDKIGRETPKENIQEIKKLAYKDIDVALKELILKSEKKLKKEGKKLHPDTIQLLEKLRS